MPNTLAMNVENWSHELRNTVTSLILATALFGSMLGPHLLSQAIDTFSLEIVPPVLIVECFIMAFVVLGLSFAIYGKRNHNTELYENSSNNESEMLELKSKKSDKESEIIKIAK